MFWLRVGAVLDSPYSHYFANPGINVLLDHSYLDSLCLRFLVLFFSASWLQFHSHWFLPWSNFFANIPRYFQAFLKVLWRDWPIGWFNMIWGILYSPGWLTFWRFAKSSWSVLVNVLLHACTWLSKFFRELALACMLVYLQNETTGYLLSCICNYQSHRV